MGTFRYLDDIAPGDCAFEISAASLDEVFETAARALTEAVVDPATVAPGVTRHVTLEAPSLDLLLFDWLSELIALQDEHAEVFVRTHPVVTGTGPCRIEARLEGGPIVPGHTVRRADPKGVTFHRFVLEPRPEGWHARVVINL
jgi:SHS2 domain-containing protein